MRKKNSSKKPAAGANWIQPATKKMVKNKTKGLFSAQAKRAGKSTLAYANAVLKSPTASTTEKKRANFAKNTIKISKSRKK